MPETKQATRVRGVRFAPSPTGRFHIGNLRTAWISHLFAKTRGTPWIVRFEDIDRPRVVPGAQAQQLDDMRALGLIPDQILIQSAFHSRHWSLFEKGVRSGQLYPCDCSRREVQEALSALASAPNDGLAPVYNGSCRPLSSSRELKAAKSLAWRFRMPSELGSEDFIVARSGPELDTDGVPAAESFLPGYHWACAVDDFDGGYQLLVRSIDLKTAAPLQRAIHNWVAETENDPRPCPDLFHTALVTQNDGHRLEKRTRGVTLSELAISPEALAAHFEQSFDKKHLYKIALGDSQESLEQLTLAQLLQD